MGQPAAPTGRDAIFAANEQRLRSLSCRSRSLCPEQWGGGADAKFALAASCFRSLLEEHAMVKPLSEHLSDLALHAKKAEDEIAAA